MATYERMLSFLSRLEEARIRYSLEHNRDEAVMVLVAVPGERWEIEFMADGEIKIEVFRSDGHMLRGMDVLDGLLARESD